MLGDLLGGEICPDEPEYMKSNVLTTYLGLAKLNLRKFKRTIFVNSVVNQNKLSIYTNSKTVFI